MKLILVALVLLIATVNASSSFMERIVTFFVNQEKNTPLSEFEKLYAKGCKLIFHMGDSDKTKVVSTGPKEIHAALTAFYQHGNWHGESIMSSQSGPVMLHIARFVGTYPDGTPASVQIAATFLQAGDKIGQGDVYGDFGSFYAGLAAHSAKKEL